MNVTPEHNRLAAPSNEKEFKALAIAGAAYLLLWVAIFNGYPTVFHDSGGYLFQSVELHPGPRQPLTYGLFIRLVSLGITPWLVILAQAVITAFMLHELCDYILQGNSRHKSTTSVFLGVVAVLAFASTAPWFVGLLMPDAFAPLQLLSLFLLLYRENLSLGKTILFSCLLALSTVVHLSNVLILVCVAAVLMILRSFRSAEQFWPSRSLRGITVFMVIPIFAGLIFIASTNWVAGMGFVTSPSGYIMVFARLLESGLAADYLRDQCKIESLTPCKYLGNLPRTRSEFLYTRYPLFNEMGGWTGSRGEAKKIVWGTVRHSPARFAAECLKQMFWQFGTFKSEEAALQGASVFTVGTIQELQPGDVGVFIKTQQIKGRLEKLEQKFQGLQSVAFWSALMISSMMALLKRTRLLVTIRLVFLTLIYLFSNALVTSSLSHVEERYQARVSWLMVLCAAASVVGVLRKRMES